MSHAALYKINLLFGVYSTNDVYKVNNLLIVIVNQFVFASKYKIVHKLNILP